MTLDVRVDTLEARVNETDGKLDLLVSIGERQLERVEALERQQKVLDVKVDVLDAKVDRILELLEPPA